MTDITYALGSLYSNKKISIRQRIHNWKGWKTTEKAKASKQFQLIFFLRETEKSIYWIIEHYSVVPFEWNIFTLN